jgi:hypothetical protein
MAPPRKVAAAAEGGKAPAKKPMKMAPVKDAAAGPSRPSIRTLSTVFGGVRKVTLSARGKEAFKPFEVDAAGVVTPQCECNEAVVQKEARVVVARDGRTFEFKKHYICAENKCGYKIDHDALAWLYETLRSSKETTVEYLPVLYLCSIHGNSGHRYMIQTKKGAATEGVVAVCCAHSVKNDSGRSTFCDARVVIGESPFSLQHIKKFTGEDLGNVLPVGVIVSEENELEENVDEDEQ